VCKSEFIAWPWPSISERTCCIRGRTQSLPAITRVIVSLDCLIKFTDFRYFFKITTQIEYFCWSEIFLLAASEKLVTKSQQVELLAPSESWDDVQFDSIFLYLEKCVKGHQGALWTKL